MAGTWYLSLSLEQEPFDAGPDEEGRAMVSFNVLALKRPSSASFVEELIAILVDADVGEAGVNIFGSSQVQIPDASTSGPFLLVRSSQGAPPVGTHNDGKAAYRRPGAQILSCARTFAAADAMAQAAYSALAAVNNAEVTA